MPKRQPIDKTQWPADQVERRKVADLVPYARNARQHTPQQVAKIAGSIREWGWTMPVLVAEDNTIIAGHGRVMAAQQLGLDDVPCMVARGWTDAQRRAYVIADNQLTLAGDWDNDMLRAELDEIGSAEFDLDLIGFDADELAGLMEGASEPEAEGAPDAGGIDYQEHFAVLVECDSEPHQSQVFERLKSDGYTCKVLVN